MPVHFHAATLDDLLYEVIKEIRQNGVHISPSKGPASELTGVLIELTNPHARLSRTETRGKPYSCLGELCWYLAGRNDLAFIHYYLTQYKDLAEDGQIYGGYGPRLFNWHGICQFRNVIDLLRRKPESRQAVLQLFDAQDLVEQHKDIPCTCTLQFLVRGGSLHLFVNMRSNDVFVGSPHDIFCFTMIQEIVASELSIEIGSYKHAVGSLHLYDKDIEAAQQFLAEGYQSTELPMPAMPAGTPWPSIKTLLEAEEALRVSGKYEKDISGLDPYWIDLIRLLQVFRCKTDKNSAEIKALLNRMASNVYSIFVEKILRDLD